MKKTYLIATVILLTFIAAGCKHNSVDPQESKTDDFLEDTSIPGDGLSVADDAFLAGNSATILPLDKIFNSDGSLITGNTKENIKVNSLENNATSPTSYLLLKNQTLLKMLKQAASLSLEKLSVDHPDAGINKPEHKGYAYSFGQRDYTQRLQPPNGNSLHKKYFVYGTDCSGLMINLLRDAGLQTPNTDAVNFESTVAKALKASTTFNGIRIMNLGLLDIASIQSGDFILWTGKKHIGIVCNQPDNGKVVYSSNGTQVPQSESQQQSNWGQTRGVHPITLSKTLSDSYWGKNYTILRLVAPGDKLFGGLIFYLDDASKHGLVCAETDQGNYRWDLLSSASNYYKTTVSGTSTDTGTGQANTTKIVNTFGSGVYAAKICDDLILNGYNDWYLPSRDELILMYRIYQNGAGNLSLGVIQNGDTIGGIGYWSSSDASNGTGIVSGKFVRFASIGYADINNLAFNQGAVRAIRSF